MQLTRDLFAIAKFLLITAAHVHFKMLIVCVVLQCQAWWRGIMVRRCLGPYKKKKKKGGKAKEKK